MISKLAILLGCLSLCFGLEYEDNIVKGPSSVGYQSRCGVLHTKHNDYFKNRSIEDSPYDVKHHVLVWQAVVLLICFGAFALLINLIQRIIRTYIYYDAHLLDTFFDAGGDMNVGMVACSIVAKWTVAATFASSTYSVREHGIVGHFWFAAGAVVHLFLFAIVAAEIRIKAPGAKTFLQVIYARFGMAAHITLMIFALLCNILVASAVMGHGVEILHQLTPNLVKEVIPIIIAIVVALFTVVGGLGGYMYLAYICSALFMAVTLAFFVEIFYDPMNKASQNGSLFEAFGDIDGIYRNVSCGKDTREGAIAITSNIAVPINDRSSLMTFLSTGGLVRGILLILSGFGSVFVNNSYWQSAVAAKPVHTVWGYLTAGLAAFSIPFAFSFSLGMAYWFLAVNHPEQLLSPADEYKGFIPLVTANILFGGAGDFLMFVLIMTAVMTTASSEVLSISSVIVYDIYQTYLAPFIPSTQITNNQKATPVRFQRAMYNEEYLEYDKRCVVLKHVVVVGSAVCLIPMALIVNAIGIDYMWLHQFTGIVVGSCTVPIALAITWHRTTGAGVTTGCIGGFVCAIIGWLVFASTHDGGLQMFRDNTFKPGPMLVGTAVSLGLGGMMCIIVSLVCGGCDADLYEDEEWEKTRELDNPVLPWSVKYAQDIGPTPMIRGRPHFYTVRRTFMCSEVLAYIVGVLFAVVIILVWPACMLTITEFELTTFKGWTLVVCIWTSVATGYLVLVPFIWELAQICKQAYYNRIWNHLEKGSTLAGGAEPYHENHGIEHVESPPHASPLESQGDQDSQAALTPTELAGE